MQNCMSQRPTVWQRGQPTAGASSQSRALPTGRSPLLLPCRRRQAARPQSPALTAAFDRGINTDTLVSDGAIRSLSPEARRIFREAQDNIIELNKSRLRALEELKSARQKITELEAKLEQAVLEASHASAQLQQLGSPSSQQASEGGAAGWASNGAGQQQQPRGDAVNRQQQQQQQQAAPAGAGPITVVYETGWGNAFLHHNLDGRGWSSSPGAKMQQGKDQFHDKKVITLTGRRLEFVINDGGNDWDKPNPYGKSKGPQNYVIESPGTYRVKNGKVSKIA